MSASATHVGHNNASVKAYGAVVMTTAISGVHPVHLMNADWASNLKASQSTRAVSSPVGCDRSHISSPFIVITQPESWYLFTVSRKVKGWVHLYEHGSKGMHTVLNAMTVSRWVDPDISDTVVRHATSGPWSRQSNSALNSPMNLFLSQDSVIGEIWSFELVILVLENTWFEICSESAVQWIGRCQKRMVNIISSLHIDPWSPQIRKKRLRWLKLNDKVGNVIVTKLEKARPCLHINIVDADTTFHVCLQRCRYAHGWLPNSLIIPTHTLLGPPLAYRLILAWLHRPSLPSW